MNKIMAFAIISVALIATISAVSAFPFGWPNVDKRDAINHAIGSKDYIAWKEIMQNELTEEKFNAIIERHEKFSGRMAGKEISMKRQKECFFLSCGKEEIKPLLDTIESGDYDAWKSAFDILEKPLKAAETVTEENFKRFAEMVKAMQNGDFETANSISEELGLSHTSMKMRSNIRFGKSGGRCPRFN